MSLWNSFVTQSTNSPSFICNDSFHNDPALHSDSENINSFKRILTGGFLQFAQSEQRANFPFSPTSHGVQVTKTVTHKTCALDNQTSVYKGKHEEASACFSALVLKAEKNLEKSDKRLEKESSQSREALSTGRVENQLDENGNPVPVEETSSKSVEATPDVVRSRKVSRFLEDQSPQKSVNSADGKATKSRKEVGGKEIGRRGTKTPGKASAQNKPKTLKSKKNEIGAKATKILEQGLSGELLHQGTSSEVKNPKQDCNSGMKNAEEDCSGERDDEHIVSLSEPDAAEDGYDDKFSDAENVLMNDDVLHIYASGQHDLEAINEDFLAESNQEIPEDRVSYGRSLSRKKRRRGKQKKQQNSNPDSLLMGDSSSSATTRMNDPVRDSCSVVLPSSASPTNSVNSVSFSCHPLSNAREKPSARVPPSRSTVVDPALNSGDVGFVSGEKNSSDLDEKTVNELSILGKQRIGEVKFCKPECHEVAKVSPFVKVEADSNNSLRVNGKFRPSLETTQSSENVLAQGSSAEVVPDTHPCVTVPASLYVCPLSPSKKQSSPVSQVSQQVKIKPQSTVNPFSVLDSTTSVQPLDVANQTHPPAPQTRIRVEPTADAKPKLAQPPRSKPRSTVNPLCLDQSQQPKFRLLPKAEPGSSLSDLANNSTVVKTAPVGEPNLAFRILRRRQSGTWKEVPTSPAKHFDSSRTDIHNSVVRTEQCTNSSYSNSCHSNSCPSVARPAVCVQSNNDDEVMMTKSRSVAKKHQNSHLSNRKFLDHAMINESIRSTTPGGSFDVKSWAVERQCGFRHGSSTCDRLPNKPTTLPKNSGPRINLCSSQISPNPVTFDLSRAQHYLHAEFVKTLELKKRGGGVIVLKL